MLTHRGFSARIVCEGMELPEYLAAVNHQENSISCWIPCVEGKSFSVHWEDHGGKVDTCSFISLDGFVVPGRFLFGNGTAFRSGVRSGNDTERPFVFSKLTELGFKGAYSQVIPSKERGTITLRIKRIERTGERPSNQLQIIPVSNDASRGSGDLRVGFGEVTRSDIRYEKTWSVKSLGSDSPKPSTYVSFVFRYRTREFLIDQGILPPSHQPSTFYKPSTKRNFVNEPCRALNGNCLITPSPSPSPRIKPNELGSSRSSLGRQLGITKRVPKKPSGLSRSSSLASSSAMGSSNWYSGPILNYPGGPSQQLSRNASFDEESTNHV